uniref:Uncharacterized protein n=1 Tax=Enterovibrio sp. FF_113 TaxID=1660266 RepID=A0A0H3ZW82_9GAMM|nr:hypothetical protein [Enterovibrio sp. FF_113]
MHSSAEVIRVADIPAQVVYRFLNLGQRNVVKYAIDLSDGQHEKRLFLIFR